MKQCIWELWKSKCSVQMYLKVIAICIFIFCLWCLILINRSATFATVDLYLLETLSFPFSRETPFSPVFLSTSMVSPSQLPMLAFPPPLTWTWAPFSSLSALIYGIKRHLCARYFHINILGPDISLECQTHASSCLFDISTWMSIVHFCCLYSSVYFFPCPVSELSEPPFREFTPRKSCERPLLIWEIYKAR